MRPEDLRNWPKEHPKVDDRISGTEEKQKQSNKKRKRGRPRGDTKQEGRQVKCRKYFASLE